MCWRGPWRPRRESRAAVASLDRDGALGARRAGHRAHSCSAATTAALASSAASGGGAFRSGCSTQARIASPLPRGTPAVGCAGRGPAGRTGPSSSSCGWPRQVTSTGWLLIPTADETALLLAQHHAELSTRYVVSTPAWDVFRWAYDKRLTHQLADDVDVARPRTCVLRDRAVAEAVAPALPAGAEASGQAAPGGSPGQGVASGRSGGAASCVRRGSAARGAGRV